MIFIYLLYNNLTKVALKTVNIAKSVVEYMNTLTSRGRKFL